MNAPLFKAEVDRIKCVMKSHLIETAENVAEIFDVAAPNAARKMVNLGDDEDPRIALSASEKVIGYSQFGRNIKQSEMKPINITQQQLILIDEGTKDEPKDNLCEGD